MLYIQPQWCFYSIVFISSHLLVTNSSKETVWYMALQTRTIRLSTWKYSVVVVHYWNIYLFRTLSNIITVNSTVWIIGTWSTLADLKSHLVAFPVQHKLLNVSQPHVSKLMLCPIIPFLFQRGCISFERPFQYPYHYSVLWDFLKCSCWRRYGTSWKYHTYSRGMT